MIVERENMRDQLHELLCILMHIDIEKNERKVEEKRLAESSSETENDSSE